MDNCPACERKFEHVFDFPIITIINVERNGVILDRIRNAVIVYDKRYVEPSNEHWERGEHVVDLPENVIALFTNLSENGKGPIEFEGWNWQRERDDWGEWEYARTKDVQKYVNQVAQRLEELVGKEVRANTLPDLFGNLNDLRFNDLTIQPRAMTNFPKINCKIENGVRRASFDVMGYSRPATYKEFTILTFEYRGRPFTVEEQAQRGKNG